MALFGLVLASLTFSSLAFSSLALASLIFSSLSPSTIALFVGFGLLIGVLFGCFGMGGSFLVTPVLLVLDYPATVAVGSGLAFVFGTSVVGALRHRAYGQVDYRLAGLVILGMTVGIALGKRTVFVLDAVGNAEAVVGVTYVCLLGSVGLLVARRARAGPARDESGQIASRVRGASLPQTISLSGGAVVSAWVVLAVGLGIGVLAGALGVGGGFLLLPAMVYGFGVPTAIAVGTSQLQIVVAGAFGTFVYALSDAVAVPVVVALLAGSTLGARIGAATTRLVDAATLEGYFAVTLLAGSVAVACELVGEAAGVESLETASALLLVGGAVLVVAAIGHASIASFRAGRVYESTTNG